MNETAKVVAKQGNIAEVELLPSSACASCGGCGIIKGKPVIIKALDEVGAKVGDTVEVEVPSGMVILSSFLIFIMPLAVFFAGFIAGGIVPAVILLAVYLAGLYWFDRKIKPSPKVIRVI